MRSIRKLPVVAGLLLLGACTVQSGQRMTPGQTAIGAVDTAATTASAAAWFEAHRERPTLLRSFLAAMPKGGDIHTHASGAVYAESYIEWSAQEKLCVNMATGVINEDHQEPCLQPEIPVRDLLGNSELFGDLVNMMSTRYVELSGQSGHDQFFEAFSKFAGGTRGNQIAELTNRAARQNVSYTEIMLSLGSAITKEFSQKVSYDGNLETAYERLIAEGLLARLPDGIQELDNYDRQAETLLGCKTASPQPGCQVTRRYLLQINRVVKPARVYSQFVYAFELVQNDPRVVGLNMVAPEDNYVALRDYELHMQMLAYLSSHYPDVPISLHAGELTIGLVPPRHLQDHIRKAVLVAGAKRIGHGVDIFYEKDPHGLLQIMRQRDVLVEICLTSNDVILGVKDREHPFIDYLNAGVPVTLATDDEGLSRIDLTNEYLRAVTTYGLGYRNVKQLARNSLSYSFLAGRSLWEKGHVPQIVDSCGNESVGSDNPSPACRALLESSQKARLQWQLERDFQRFERSPWL